ncbi:transposable element Tc3 transposase [Trichonephila clavipes]|nr:transposable element Tc3 transposase [Trichonephila clavipes]
MGWLKKLMSELPGVKKKGKVGKFERLKEADIDIPVKKNFQDDFGLAIHQNDHQARRSFVKWAQTEIAVFPDIHKRILFSDEAHFWLKGYVNKQNCRISSEANPQVNVETPLHPEKLTAWCALWAGGIIGPYSFKNDEGHNVTVKCDRYRAMITNFFIPILMSRSCGSNKTAQHVTQLVPQSIY